MKKFYLLALFMALTITVAACTPKQQQEATDVLTNDSMMEDDSMMASDVVVHLSAQNSSGQSGTATLKSEGNSTRVILEVGNAPANVAQPAHVHLSSCATIGGVKYPLDSLVNGRSETLLAISLDDLTSQEQLSINVHKSAAEASVYVACGDLPFDAMKKDDSAMMEDDSMMADDDATAEDDSMVKDDSMMADDSAMMEDVKTFTVGGSNFSFDVQEIRVKEGDKVKITLVNNGGFHDLVIDEFNVATSQIQAGQTSSIEFVANKKGTFEYYCSVGAHRQQGMVGKLIVE